MGTVTCPEETSGTQRFVPLVAAESWEGVIELPAGLQQEFFSELNKRTQGNAETQRER